MALREPAGGSTCGDPSCRCAAIAGDDRATAQMLLWGGGPFRTSEVVKLEPLRGPRLLVVRECRSAVAVSLMGWGAVGPGRVASLGVGVWSGRVGGRPPLRLPARGAHPERVWRAQGVFARRTSFECSHRGPVHTMGPIERMPTFRGCERSVKGHVRRLRSLRNPCWPGMALMWAVLAVVVCLWPPNPPIAPLVQSRCVRRPAQPAGGARLPGAAGEAAHVGQTGRWPSLLPSHGPASAAANFLEASCSSAHIIRFAPGSFRHAWRPGFRATLGEL